MLLSNNSSPSLSVARWPSVRFPTGCIPSNCQHLTKDKRTSRIKDSFWHRLPRILNVWTEYCYAIGAGRKIPHSNTPVSGYSPPSDPYSFRMCVFVEKRRWNREKLYEVQNIRKKRFRVQAVRCLISDWRWRRTWWLDSAIGFPGDSVWTTFADSNTRTQIYTWAIVSLSRLL